MARAPTPSLLLDVWREVGRHIELDDSLQNLAPIVAQTLPVARLVVRRLDVAARRLDALAAGGEPLAAGAARRDLDPAEVARLQAWLASGELLLFELPRDAAGPRAALACPPGLRGTVLVGPLPGSLAEGDGGAGGLLLLEGPPELAERANVVQLLLEPFAVALRNDRRLHELARLREAAEADNRALLARLQRSDIADTIVGAEGGLREVMTRVDQVAPTEAPVLILGETGSGKEVVARAIHARSRRGEGPFLRVNCGAIPSELVDSELFGHERGAFTGALSQRKGWFERADGGTLFLDEVGELPPAAQVRLLRVLQDGSFERVGGQHALHVDVRIVAATHRDLAALIAEGRFRQDLWFRIGVFPIRLPPLRERPADVDPLARHFAERAGMRLCGVPLVPTREDLAQLRAYPWPGNVRELAAVIERATILGNGSRLEIAGALGAAAPSLLPPPVAATAPLSAPPASAPASGASGEPAGSLDAAMVRAIEEALRAAGGRIEGSGGAADRLGVNPHTLRSRMRKLGVDWQRFRGGR
ncbi:MAG: sigma-54-dependent Fis family transcriptional regulator [Planctomycetes bacterium]|nr:sigma-54-dependent Fis family transcriptional regulator [Planctomycetota bacterium]